MSWSPELGRNEAYGAEIDIWALGVFAYELATGKVPYG